MSSTKYRPDIDGLRAIAVLSVLFYHLEFKAFSGGFVGVDVFFVISGFLITGIIRDEVLTTGSFNYSNFYIRRARRLFPALFITLLTTTIFAATLFSPQHLERYGGSLVHAIMSVSNFFFWLEAGYFDESARVKPLLHTWSLSIEEQFYLLWPITLVFLLKSRVHVAAPITLFAIGIFSLYLNPIFSDGHVQTVSNVANRLPEWFSIDEWISDGQATIFYLLPFRTFEFAIGGLLVWGTKYTPINKVFSEIVLCSGLLLIMYSVFTFTETIIFPSFNALIPCFGAALVIYSGRETISGHILSNPISVGIGLISYSLYLVHWPIIVFWEYWKFDELVTSEKIIIVILSTIFAYLMYKFVEQPFRQKRKSNDANKTSHLSSSAFLILAFALSVTLIIPASNMWSNNGWSWRIPNEIRNISENLKESRAATWGLIPKFNLDNFPSNNKVNLIIIGDSHGKDMFNSYVLNESLKSYFNIAYIRMENECLKGIPEITKSIVWSEDESRNTLLETRCPAMLKKFKKSALLKNADWVMLSFRWLEKSYFSNNLIALESILQNASANRAKLILLGRTVEFKMHVPRLVVNFGRIHPHNVLEKYVSEYRDTNIDIINEKLRSLSQNKGWTYIDKYPLLCNSTASQCNVLNSKNELIFYDYGHWTLEGAQLIGERILKSQDFTFMHADSST